MEIDCCEILVNINDLDREINRIEEDHPMWSKNHWASWQLNCIFRGLNYLNQLLKLKPYKQRLMERHLPFVFGELD